jgi:hypothetical protein
MRTSGLIAAGLAAAALWTAAVTASPRQAGEDADPLEQFYTAVDAYVALHQTVEASVPPLEISPDGEEIRAAIEAMATAMREARPAAAEGDIFNADAAAILRRTIRTTVRDAGCDVAAMRAAEADEPRSFPAPRPLVHDRFDWEAGSFTPWCLLAVLPRLPEELQYRFVGRDLVLVDIHADLVVDVLADAFPASESWRGMRYL